MNRLVSLREQHTSLLLESTSVSVGRVTARVLDGGHHVPTADIVWRFGRSQRNFWFTYRPLADHWNLISNTGDDFLEEPESEGPQLTLFDDQTFWRFVLPLDPTFILP